MKKGRVQQLRGMPRFGMPRGMGRVGRCGTAVGRTLGVSFFVLVGVLVCTGCHHGGLSVRGGGAADLLVGYEDADGYVVLTTPEVRAVVQSDTDATLVFSTLRNGSPLVLEHPGRAVDRASDRSADRLLTGLSGPVGLFPGDWQVLAATATRHKIQRDVRLEGVGPGTDFALTIQREIRLLGRHALSGYLAGTLAADLEVGGYESRTHFTNPGPLPWPAGSGLPYIRIESDLWRNADVVWFLNVQPGLQALWEGQTGLRYVVHESALVGVHAEPSAARIVVPLDLVLPRMALLDREQGVLTLIAYTPPLGLAVTRDAGVMRPDPEIVLSAVEGGQRWFRVATSGAAFPLATGGSNRHHRQTFHVRGTPDALVQIGAAFCRLPLEDVHDLLAVLDEVAE